MAGDGLPIALSLLKDEPSDAADDVLLAALPRAGGRTRRAIMDVLAGRGRARAGVELVRLFGAGPAEVSGLIVEYAEALHSPLRSMMSSVEFADRRTAIDFIVAARDTRSSYLLSEALRHKDSRTRELCAAALLGLAEGFLEERQRRAAGAASLESAQGPGAAAAMGAAGQCAAVARNAAGAAGQCAAVAGNAAGAAAGARRGVALGAVDEVAAAVSDGIRAWEAHVQPAVLTAALLLIDRTEAAVRAKLGEGHSRFVQAASHALESCHDPRLAGAVLRALGIAELRGAAAHGLVRARQRQFMEAVLTESWVLADPAIEHGCRWVRMDQWADDWAAALLGSAEEVAAHGLRFVAAAGGSSSAKYAFYKELLSRGGGGVRWAVFWVLVADESEASTQMLVALAGRQEDALSAAARRECGRRELGAGARVQAEVAPGPANGGLDRGWEDRPVAASRVEEEPVRAGAAEPLTVRRRVADLLESRSALERLDGLQFVSHGADAAEHAEAVYRLCSDAEPAVRAAAVALLSRLPGPTGLRILRSALNDPEARVQANAIEALDAIGVVERARLVAGKLNAADNRVRANAIKTCLRAEMHQAAEALLAMLESPSATHRVGALWVVEQLRLGSVSGRVREMMEADEDARVRARAGEVLGMLSAERAAAGAGAI